jgi:hypothetical protein
LSQIWPGLVKASPKITAESALTVILVSIILLPNTFVVSTFNFVDFYTDQGRSHHNYAFATLDGETNSLTPSTSANLDTDPGSIEYNARFFCGTIVGQDGPLRPGRYNSDINILIGSYIQSLFSGMQFPLQPYKQAKMQEGLPVNPILLPPTQATNCKP